MFKQRRPVTVIFLLQCVLYSGSLVAQQNISPPEEPQLLHRPQSLQLVLDVVAANANGPVNNLAQQNFTVLIDKKPVPVSGFHSATLQNEQAGPVEIVLVIDEHTAPLSSLDHRRNEIRRFLEQNTGKLKHPVRLAFLSWRGCEIQADATRDGNAVLAAFDQHSPGPNTAHNSTAHLTSSSLKKIAAAEAKVPGRKLVVWIAPGWPIFNSAPGVELSAHERNGIFGNVLSISTALQQARITLYCVNSGDADSNSTYYEAFLKPLTSRNDAEQGDENTQVRAVQSGGLVLEALADVPSMLAQCMAEADLFYTLTVVAPMTGPEKFHEVEVKVNVPGVKARTRYGYYG